MTLLLLHEHGRSAFSVSRLATIAAAVVATARDVGGAEKAEAGHR